MNKSPAYATRGCACACMCERSCVRVRVCACYVHKSSHHLSKSHAHTTLCERPCKLSNALSRTQDREPHGHGRKMHVQLSMGVAVHAAGGAIADALVSTTNNGLESEMGRLIGMSCRLDVAKFHERARAQTHTHHMHTQAHKSPLPDRSRL